MNHLYTTATSCGFGLIMGNLIFAALVDRDWNEAAKRIWFQMIAIGIVVWRLAVTVGMGG